MSTAFVGARLRQLRDERGLNQVELAKVLSISASYLNQLEHNTRPLTVPVLLRISEVFGVDASFFAPQDTNRLLAEVSEVLLDKDLGIEANPREVAELVAAQPKLAEALVVLYRRHHLALDQLGQLSNDATASLMPHEQVRDFFYRHTYLDELDRSAEALSTELGPHHRQLLPALARRLSERHDVAVVEHDDPADALHQYDPNTRVLTLATGLRPNQKAFRLARQVALLEHEPVLVDLSTSAGLGSDQAHELMITGLANYFAAAVVLPYTIFRTTAEEFRYDLERLSTRFEVGFETVCHRLSTLQRPRSRAVPFSFVRVDRAGNVSKRLSATPFHFSSTGSTCPLWNVYEAFAAPGKVLVQVAAMPDGHRYLWVARTVTHSARRYGAPAKTFAVGLGCEARHAGRLVYSTGIDLDDRSAATPIGTGCKMCERTDCAQRAFPPLGRQLAADPNRSTFVPYPVSPATTRH